MEIVVRRKTITTTTTTTTATATSNNKSRQHQHQPQQQHHFKINKREGDRIASFCIGTPHLNNEALVLIVKSEEFQQAIQGARLTTRGVVNVTEIRQLNFVPAQNSVCELVCLPHHMLLRCCCCCLLIRERVEVIAVITII